MTPTREADVIDAEVIHDRLYGEYWSEPEPYGEDSWVIYGPDRKIIVSVDNYSDPEKPWIHASISYDQDWRIPSYSDMKQMHMAVFGLGHAYQCFVPPGEHINIKGNVLHLFGRLDGKPALPNFGRTGTI
jgi:hypothetical protein